MDPFSSLPDEIIENIISYCPFIDHVRSGRINQRLRSISTDFLGSSTKILTERHFMTDNDRPSNLFSQITEEQLTHLFETCKYRLENVKFRLRTVEDAKKLARSLSRVEFPRLIKIIISSTYRYDARMMDPLADMSDKYDDDDNDQHAAYDQPIDTSGIVMCGDDIYGAGAINNGDSSSTNNDQHVLDDGIEIGQNLNQVDNSIADADQMVESRLSLPPIDDDGIDGGTFEQILRRCPKLCELAVSCLSEQFVLPSSNNNVAWPSIEHLRVGNVYEPAFRSLIGRFPNLREFVCDMGDCPTTESVDEFCRFIPHVEKFRLFPTNPSDGAIENGEEVGKIKFRDMNNIWRLHSLRDFRVAPHFDEFDPEYRYRCVNMTDQELEMMARAFPRLEVLVLDAIDQLSYDGFRAIVSLRELRRFVFVESPQSVSDVFDFSGTIDRSDPVESTKLISYQGHGLLCPRIFAKFVAATCETLKYMRFDGILFDGDEGDEYVEMDREEIVVEMLRALDRRLSRLPPRRGGQSTTIKMRFIYVHQIAVWRSVRVVEELDGLKANCGVELKLLGDDEYDGDEDDWE